MRVHYIAVKVGPGCLQLEVQVRSSALGAPEGPIQVRAVKRVLLQLLLPGVFLIVSKHDQVES